MLKREMLVPAISIVVLFFSVAPALAEMIVDTAWVRTYDGGAAIPDDVPRDMVLDDSGNVYVTGTSQSDTGWYDFLTIRYYPDGDTAWVRRYNAPADSGDHPTALAVDGQGNVYVTGRSWGGETVKDDFLTVKYYANGDTAWVRRYNGAADRNDWAYSVAVDASGHVYVTGGDVPVGGSCDYATVKYDPNGDTLWVRRYNSSSDSVDCATCVALDASGNVYVTGTSYAIGTESDIVTIKYRPDGEIAWVSRYNGPGDYWDHPKDMAIDDLGNVYVAGYSSSADTSIDYVTIKYLPYGDTAWLRRYDGPGHSWDQANAIEVDSSGNVCVTGRSTGVGTSSDYATIKYYPNGDTAWVRRYDNAWHAQDEANDIALDDAGNVYVTGASWNGSSTGEVFATLKYLSDGQTAWLRRFDVKPLQADVALVLALDASHNVYVTGRTGVYHDMATMKYFQIIRGDANGDGIINVGDVVYLVSYLYKAGPAPEYLVIGDCNCDEVVDVGDIVHLVNYLYRGGDPPDC